MSDVQSREVDWKDLVEEHEGALDVEEVEYEFSNGRKFKRRTGETILYDEDE